jgi:hypothetical protein
MIETHLLHTCSVRQHLLGPFNKIVCYLLVQSEDGLANQHVTRTMLMMLVQNYSLYTRRLVRVYEHDAAGMSLSYSLYVYEAYVCFFFDIFILPVDRYVDTYCHACPI